MLKFLERIFQGLTDAPIQSTVALVIFLLAIPFIRKGLRERPPAPPPTPVSAPLEVTQPWIGPQILHQTFEVDRLHRRIDDLRSDLAMLIKAMEQQTTQLDALLKLMRRRVSRRK